MSRESANAQRPQSKMDDALLQYTENLENLGKTLSVLEENLRPVINNYPRPTRGEGETEFKEESSGDSSLVVQTLKLNMTLRSQEERVRGLIERLDI